MTAVAALLTFAVTIAQVEPDEKKRVPNDSIELTVVGCLKGRVLTTVARQEVDVQRGPAVGERTFRLAGSREVMAEVQRRRRQLVEVVGIVKRSALDDQGMKSGKISFAGGSPAAGTGKISTGVENVPTMDVTSVRVRATSCE